MPVARLSLVVAALALASSCGSESAPRNDSTSAAGTDETAAASTTSSGLDGSSTGANDSSSGPGTTPWSGPLVVMSFNVLCSFCDDTFDLWEDRVPWMGDTIERHAPDIVGLQELAFPEDVDDVLAVTPLYSAIFWGSDGQSPYPDATVLYRTELFEPIDHGFYWLSPTPDQPNSTGFSDGFQLARLVTWTVLQRKSDGAELFFATTHFDNNAPSQDMSAPLVLERTPAAAGDRPIVVVGDFNSRPDSTAYATLTSARGFHFDDAFDLAPMWSMDTNQRPVPTYDTNERIDHVFLAGAPWQVTRWVVDTWHYGDNDKSISDHFAIVAEIELP